MSQIQDPEPRFEWPSDRLSAVASRIRFLSIAQYAAHVQDHLEIDDDFGSEMMLLLEECADELDEVAKVVPPNDRKANPTPEAGRR
jgi:hypothetical protein